MIAVAAPQRDYLSYSAVRTFQGCPLSVGLAVLEPGSWLRACRLKGAMRSRD